MTKEELQNLILQQAVDEAENSLSTPVTASQMFGKNSRVSNLLEATYDLHYYVQFNLGYTRGMEEKQTKPELREIARASVFTASVACSMYMTTFINESIDNFMNDPKNEQIISEAFENAAPEEKQKFVQGLKDRVEAQFNVNVRSNAGQEFVNNLQERFNQAKDNEERKAIFGDTVLISNDIFNTYITFDDKTREQVFEKAKRDTIAEYTEKKSEDVTISHDHTLNDMVIAALKEHADEFASEDIAKGDAFVEAEREEEFNFRPSEKNQNKFDEIEETEKKTFLDKLVSFFKQLLGLEQSPEMTRDNQKLEKAMDRDVDQLLEQIKEEELQRKKEEELKSRKVHNPLKMSFEELSGLNGLDRVISNENPTIEQEIDKLLDELVESELNPIEEITFPSEALDMTEIVGEPPQQAVFINETPEQAVVIDETPQRGVIIDDTPLQAVPEQAVITDETPQRAVIIDDTPLQAVPEQAVITDETPQRGVIIDDTPLQAVPEQAIIIDETPQRGVLREPSEKEVLESAEAEANKLLNELMETDIEPIDNKLEIQMPEDNPHRVAVPLTEFTGNKPQINNAPKTQEKTSPEKKGPQMGGF